MVLADKSTGSLTLACSAGKKALGGGVTYPAIGTDDKKVHVTSGPSSDTQWHMLIGNDATVTITFTLHIICATVS